MKIFIYIIFFFIIFNFPIPKLHSSLLLANVFMIFMYCKNGGANEYLISFKKILKSIQFSLVVFLYIGVIILVFLWPILHGTYDFSMIKKVLLSFITVITTILFIPFVLKYIFITNEGYIVQAARLIVVIFTVQSIIEILAFIFPPVYDLVFIFRKQKIGDFDYGGIRGLGLTGNPFFTLSAGFALSFLCFFYLYALNKIKKPILFLLTLFVGSFFAGRTAFVGLLVGVLIYFSCSFFNLKMLSTKLVKIIVIILSILVLLLFVYYAMIPEETKDIVDELLLPFVFEMFYNYQETGELTTSSSDALYEMYFPIDYSTFLYGDGRYTGENGLSYYKHTDAGYMRNILYSGILGVLYIAIGQILLFLKPIFRENSNGKLFLIYFLLFLFVLEYKGEVLLTSTLSQVIVMLFSFSFLFEKNSLCQN